MSSEGAANRVWLVTGYDVGGNSGNVVVAVFSDEAAAKRWAEESPERKWNHAFGGTFRGSAFEVEEWEVYSTFDEAAAEPPA